MRYCADVMKNIRYSGSVASRSTMPKNENAYFLGSLVQYRRSRYSAVKNSVVTHSMTKNSVCRCTLNHSTLSSMVMSIEKMMSPISTTSNILPAGVSVPNITVWSLSFHFWLFFT